jgi:hypothetical protein
MLFRKLIPDGNQLFACLIKGLYKACDFTLDFTRLQILLMNSNPAAVSDPDPPDRYTG